MADKIRVLTDAEIEQLVEAGMTDEEIVALKADEINELFPKQTKAEPVDLNPLPAIGKIAQGVGNFMDIPAGFMRSVAYKGDVSGATQSPAYEQFKESLGNVGEGEFLEAIKNYNQALQTGLPRSEEYLKGEPTQTSFLGKGLKQAYDASAKYPVLQKGIGFASDVAFDPLAYLGSVDAVKATNIKGIPLNPDTAIGQLFEEGGKKVHSLPFIPVDVKLRQKGYNPFSKLAYDQEMGGSFSNINKQNSKFIDDTTDSTKGAISMLSKQKQVTGETENLREPLIAKLKESFESMGMYAPENEAKLIKDIEYWTANKPRNDENVLTMLANREAAFKFRDAMKKYNEEPKFNLINGKITPVPKPVAPTFLDLNMEELPLEAINLRKSKLNKLMRSKEFDLTSDYTQSDVKDNLRNIRDAMQGLEEKSISDFNPIAGAEIKSANKDLSTAIEAENFLNSREARSVLDITRPLQTASWGVSKGVVPLLTKPPILFKKARESKAGGFVDAAIRRGIFDILGKLKEDEEQPQIPLRGN